MVGMTIYTLNALMNHGGGKEDPGLYTIRESAETYAMTFEEALSKSGDPGKHILTPYERKFFGLE